MNRIVRVSRLIRFTVLTTSLRYYDFLELTGAFNNSKSDKSCITQLDCRSNSYVFGA